MVVENELIALLPRQDRSRLLAICELAELEMGAVLSTPGESTRYAYFPRDCLISVETGTGRQRLAVGLLGREGMLGTQVVLGVGAMLLHAAVQGAGTAWRVRIAPFRREFDQSQALQRILNRYLYVQMMELASAACCARFHSLGPRLARLLLMGQDRSQSDSICLTQDVLARMLGVRRVGITVAASQLKRCGLLRYRRGEITVLDRAGLEVAACDCYAANLDAYQRLLVRSREVA